MEQQFSIKYCKMLWFRLYPEFKMITELLIQFYEMIWAWCKMTTTESMKVRDRDACRCMRAWVQCLKKFFFSLYFDPIDNRDAQFKVVHGRSFRFVSFHTDRFSFWPFWNGTIPYWIINNYQKHCGCCLALIGHKILFICLIMSHRLIKLLVETTSVFSILEINTFPRNLHQQILYRFASIAHAFALYESNKWK